MVTPHQPADTDGASLSCHACLIYRSAGERWNRVADFVGTGLERDERVLCLTDLDREDTFLSRLRSAGLDAGDAVDSGQLLIRPAGAAYLTGGRFSAEESLRQLRTAIRRAARQGWAGFRIAGDTGWVTPSSPESPRLVQYERRAGRVLDRYGCAGLCQYRADGVDDTTLSELRRVHSRVLEERPGADGRSRSRAPADPGKRPDGGGASDPVPGPADARHSHALLENISDIVTEIDRDGTIVYESPSVERVLGYRPEDRIGTDVFDFVHPEDREQARARFREAFSRPGEVDSMQVRIRHADGRWRLLEVRGVRPPGSPPVRGMIATSRDITDRETRSERLERSRLRRLSRRLLQTRDEERRRLSRELHDSVGQTLAALRIGVGGLLAGRRDGASGREDRGEEILSMMDRAIEEVQEMSASLRPAVVDEEELFPSLREFARSRAADAGLEVRFRSRELPGCLDARVATACLRIAREAVTNVIRHADAARLTVTLGPSAAGDEHLLLEVADDGRGFRSGGDGGDRSGEEPGLTGMLERALSVGGNLDVDSEPGRGTRVRARLPLAGA